MDEGSLNGDGCVDHEARRMAAEAYGRAADMLREVHGIRQDMIGRLDEVKRMVRRKLASVPELVEEEIKTNPGLRQPTTSERAAALESAIKTLGTKWIAHIAIGAAGTLALDLLVRWLLATVFHH
jgi:hypothetical protein